MRRRRKAAKERVICVDCGRGTTLDRASWKRRGRAQCGGCGRWIKYQDINAE